MSISASQEISATDKYPNHVAMIMDGNNRWARCRGLSGSEGHRAGAEAARRAVYYCVHHEIKFLTLFAFSSENWLRPHKEVKGLMALFLAVLQRKEILQMHNSNVRLQFIGKRDSFPAKLQEHMLAVENLTRQNTGTVVTVAADYGGRWDIVQAARKLAEAVEAGSLRAAAIDTDALQKHICLADMPMPDLCIRTGGESRISNFLLWQMAYTELYFTDCYWPDFDDLQFQLAVDDFTRRQRRYGYLEAGREGKMDSDEQTVMRTMKKGPSGA
ncbi:MAG: polyprenyl diphosphate synthase [Pseudomonadales bacterium]|nr:polyprenyl diphosphate synthase [Pseudomonadales bacterium]